MEFITLAESIQFFYGNSILYLAIASLLILYRIFYNENSNRTPESVVIMHVCKLLVVHAVSIILYTIMNILVYDYGFIAYPFMTLLIAFFGILSIYIATIYPYFLFVVLRKNMSDKKIFVGTLNRITCIFMGLYTAAFLIITVYNLGFFYRQDDFAFNILFEIIRVSAVVQFLALILCVKEIHKFTSRLFMTSFFSKTIYEIGMTIFIYIPVIIWPIALMYAIPLSFVTSVSFVFVVHVISQSNSVSRDFLTGMNNRNELIRFLTKLYAKKDDLTSKWNLIFIDINKFKSINDTYGHSQGDKALISMARCLFKSSFSSNCFLCRYAGDEFVVVLKENGADTVEQFMLNLQSNLDILNQENVDPYKLAVSYGSVSYCDEFKEIDKFIQAADQKMYTAKENNPAK